MCNFKIGQKVVCIQNDKVYTILGIRNSMCRCDTAEVDVGLRGYYAGMKCCGCGSIIDERTDIAWKDSCIFRPIESTYTEEEIEAVNIDELVCPELETV